MLIAVAHTATLALCATLAVTLAGCASAPAAPQPQQLFADALFERAPSAPRLQDIFALSPAMRAYAERDLSPLLRQTDPRRAFIDALYNPQRLGLAYDASSTRNAAQAFAARAGNCLSLVIMTASFARHLGLPVSFQAVATDDYYSRSGGLTLASTHVNLVLGPPGTRTGFGRRDNEALTIDFLPQDELRGQRTRPLEERTIVAMYFNNRAAESLVAGRLSEAYAHARAALLQDPGFHAAANTLGVVYNRAGHLAQAQAAFRHTLDHEPDSVSALSNLVQLLGRQGPTPESAALSARLERLQPQPPFKHFNLGRLAMDSGDHDRARDHFLRELRLQPYQDEVHFWAALAYWRLGQAGLAARHLDLAVKYSPTPDSHDRYAAKLAQLRHNRL